MGRWWFAAYCILVSSLMLTGQEVKFSASTDAREIIAGNYFQVTFTLENAKGGRFEAPSFEGFDILSGPNRSSQMSIVNGQVSQKISFSYTLTTDNPGSYSIGPARIEVDNGTMESQAVAIQVLPPDPNARSQQNPESENFIRLEISNDMVHIGQQVTLKYVLYTTADVRSFNFTRLPQFDGFFAQEIQNYTDRPVQVVENGKQYVRRTIKVIALFPQQKGIFEIEGAKVNIGIASKGSRSSFFFNTYLKPVAITTESTHIQVVDLPGGNPSSFSGGVGKFELATSLDKTTIQRDDAITLTLQIRGDGDNKFIQAPEQPFFSDFEVYDPNLLREQTVVRGGRIELTKTFEYLLVPRRPGKISFKPELSYFDIDSNTYVTLYGNEYVVEVLQSVERRVAEFDEQEIVLPPMFSVTRLKKKSDYFYGSTTFWVANGALAFGFLGLLLVRQVKNKRDAIDPSLKRFDKAKKMAIKTLLTAKQSLEAGDTNAFYANLRKSILAYIADKTSNPSAQLTKDDVKVLLSNNQLGEIMDEVILLLEKGEQALYAPLQPGGESESYELAVDLIKKMETEFKK